MVDVGHIVLLASVGVSSGLKGSFPFSRSK